VDLDKMPGARFFPDARLNFAENLLRARDGRPCDHLPGRGRPADAHPCRTAAMRSPDFAAALRAAGIGPGDRVAGYLPNLPEAIIACSPPPRSARSGRPARRTSGSRACSTASGRSSPACSSRPTAISTAARRTTRSPKRSRRSLAQLPTVERRRGRAVRGRSRIALDERAGAVLWNRLHRRAAGDPLEFERLPFDHPLYILYSSGTTGVPKCIVHGAGGTLLQHLKEHQLHCDVKPDDRVFYFTTCGWMMWNWL
jgi:acetoacetyl-CoA synthetase